MDRHEKMTRAVAEAAHDLHCASRWSTGALGSGTMVDRIDVDAALDRIGRAFAAAGYTAEGGPTTTARDVDSQGLGS